MPSFLPLQGTLSYYGFIFPVETEVMVISGTPVQDRAQRTVTYVVWRLAVRSKILAVSGQTNDFTLTQIRQILTSQGGDLEYHDKGFGDLSINSNVNNKRDARWGPIPRMLSWKPLGGNIAAEIEWQVEVAIPECTDPNYSNFPGAVNYSCTYDNDEQGYTIRTINGYLEIPMTRITQSNRSLPDSVDDPSYLDFFYPLIPTGFRRTNRSRTIDESKRILRFVVRDEELPPQILQRGVVDCQASHSMTNAGNNIYAMYNHTITATYTLSKLFDKREALQLFKELLFSRISATVEAGPVTGKGSVFIIPTNFSMEDPDIFGRTAARFSYSWRSALSLADIMSNSGMWTPIVNTDYDLWRTSLGTVMGARGLAGQFLGPADDLIVDLCMRFGQNNPGSTLPPPSPIPGTTIPLFPLWLPTKPSEAFLRAQHRIGIELFSGVMPMKTIPQEQVNVLQSSIDIMAKNVTPPLTGGRIVQSQVGGNLPSNPVDPMFLTGTPVGRMIHDFAGITARFPPNLPVLQSLGGIPLVPIASSGNSSPVANWGTEIFQGWCRNVYYIPCTTGVRANLPAYQEYGQGFDPSNNPSDQNIYIFPEDADPMQFDQEFSNNINGMINSNLLP